MSERMDDLEGLERRYKAEIADLESRLSESNHKLSVVIEAMALLKKESTFAQPQLFGESVPVGDRYSSMNLTAAVIDAIRTAGTKVTADFVIKTVQANGFKSKSSNMKRDVYTRLLRLQKRGVLGYRKDGGLKKYFILKDKSEDSEQGSDKD
jgi:hypothetical protein